MIFPLFVDIFLTRNEENIPKMRDAFREINDLLEKESPDGKFLLNSAEPQMCDVTLFPPVHRTMMLEYT